MNTAASLESTKDLGDYLDAFRRHRRGIIAISMAIFFLGIIIAFIWPPTYQSTATILIEEQEIPSELVRSTVTSYALQRIQEIKARVMTRSRLMEIIKKFDLYADDFKRKTTEEVLEKMRAAIAVDPLTADVLDRTGRKAVATIAFTLSYEGDDPLKVQKVTNELTTVYLEENLKSRTTKARETFKFLAAEADRHATDINALEQKLSEFKIKYVGYLSGMNHATSRMERTRYELENARTSLRALEDRRVYLEEQLSATSPYKDDTDLSPEARLKALRTNYISMLARYSDKHPDVLRTKREIEALEAETGSVDPTLEIREQIAAARMELSVAKERYSENHPDIIRLTETIARLEAHLDTMDTSIPEQNHHDRLPDNPEYKTLQSQLSQVKSGITAARLKQKSTEAKLDELEEHMAKLPDVERRYKALSRAHENAIAKFQEIKAKELQAKVAQQLEDESKGERFTLIEAAALPEEPTSPNRPAILFLSLVLAIGGGIGFATISESMDKSVRGVKGVINAVQVAPLSVIPYLANDGEVEKGKRKVMISIGAAVAVLAIIVLLIHFYWIPLDVLWFKALRRASNSTGIDFE